MERRGIATAAIALVHSVAERLRAPRLLSVPFPFGRPLGEPHDAAGQRRVLRAVLRLLEESGPGPVLRAYRPD